MEETLGAIIARKRKELGLTQEALGDALGVSYQAVSKWENELSSPDISALPLLADTLGLSIDALFGRGGEAPREALIPAAPAADPILPWPDDGTLHAVLFEGHRLVSHESAGDRIFSRKQLTLELEGDVRDVYSDFSVNVEGEVRGSVTAGGGVDCANVGGSVMAGGSVDCGDVGHDLSAGGSVDCGGVGGSVTAGGDVDCGSVGGDVRSGGDVDCGSVRGSVYAEGSVEC